MSESLTIQTSPLIPTLDKVIYFSLFTFVAFSMFSISITQISFGIGTLAWLLKVQLTNSWKKVRGTQVGITILCFILACIFAIFTSVDLENSLGQIKKLAQFSIFFWVANTVQNEKQRDLLFAMVIITGAFAALYGISKVFGTEFNLLSRIQEAKIHSATFAGILMLTVLLSFGRFLFSKPREYWVLGNIVIVAFCLLFTLTRQAWLGFILGVSFLVYFWNKKFLLVVPVLIAGLFLLAPEAIKDRLHTFGNIKESSFQSRISLWKGGWEIFKDHPVTGCGFKCVDAIHSQYPDPSGWLGYFRGMHSNIFQLLVDTGVVGLGTWLSIWIAYFFSLSKKWVQTNSGNTRSLIMGSSAAVLGFLMGGLFETSIYDSEVVMLLYFLMGLSLAEVKKAPEDEPAIRNIFRIFESNNFIPWLEKLIQFSLYTFIFSSMFSITITQISFTIGTLTWLYKTYLTSSWKEVQITPIGLPILCFCLASFLAVAFSIDPETSFKSLKKILQFVVFFWVANTVVDEKQKDLIMQLLIFAGLIASLVGFSQAWTNVVSLETRVSGTMSIYMTFAGLLMLLGLLAASRVLFNNAKEAWVIGALGIISFCLLLTLTRQAWLGFFCGIVMLILFWNKKYLLTLPLLLVGLLLFSPESVKDRLFSLIDFKDWTLQARLYLWQGGWEIFKDYPITGCGFKCVDLLHAEYPDPSGYISRYRGMHSNIAQLLVDTGIIGFGTWLSIWLTFFITMYKNAVKNSNQNDRGLLFGASAAVTSFLVGGIFETNFYDSEVIMLLYFIMGLSLAKKNGKTYKNKPENSTPCS